MNELNTFPLWHLIIIDDPEGLPGKTIFNVLQLLHEIIHYKFVVLHDINGAYVAPLVRQEGKIIKIQSIFNNIQNVKQFDWGDFFLFKEYPKHWEKIEGCIYYPNFIIKSDTTIRAVDDTYVYIYTPYAEIIKIMGNNFKIDAIKNDYLDNLDYPY